MNKFKKVLALFLAVILAVTVFTACGGTDSKDTKAPGQETEKPEESKKEDTKAPDTEPAPDTKAPDEEVVNIKICFPIMDNVPEDMEKVQAAMSEITMERYNCTVELMPLGFMEMSSQAPLMLAGNEDVGLMICFNPISIYSTLVARGQIQDITDLLDEYAPDVLTTIGETFLAACRVDGRLYGVPTLHDLATGLNITMRKDLVDKYNIDVSSIKGWDDLEPIFQTIKDNEPDVAPFFVGGASRTIGDSLIMAACDGFGDQFGVLMDWGTKDLNVVDYFETDEYKEICERMYDWNKKGYIIPDSDSITDSSTVLLKAGRIFSYIGATKPGQLQQDERVTGMELAQAELYPASTKTHLVSGIQWVVPAGASHPEKSVQLLNLLYNDADFLNLFNYGLEGEHYVKVSDTQISLPDGVTSENAKFQWSIQFESGNEFITYTWKEDDPDLWDQTKKYNNEAICSKAMGFSFDNANVTAEITAVTNAAAQYRVGLENGILDPEEYIPKLVNDIKAAGIDDIIAEKQKQLDEWAKNQ